MLAYPYEVTWVVPLALGGFAILLMAVVSTLSAARARRRQARPATSAGPRILVHDINDDRCTGCDACVAVCPTNVLDLVNNKSRVLRFHDCIQCEACMWACPTEALVMFPEGATPPALKIPDIDENFMTRVPGQYLIGEVAGKPLVKNAANLGRAVVEHMLRNGLAPSGGAPRVTEQVTVVDVAIVGSGPGGLSAALTCMQRGLSYVILEKEQLIASTIARYPKGKLVMAEPYDTKNVSLLPVFDSSKEQIIPIWRELIDRLGLDVKLGEAVEGVKPTAAGFDVRTTVAAYRAQRVVLATGTRGKPRTLQVPGENLPKVANLLDDPADWRGKSVIVIGGGDSAAEAALALADAGAKVIVSYRGRAFNRAAPKNKSAIESYAAQGRLKVKLQSQVIAFEADSVILQLLDGSQKRYPNAGAFVLIGADPPIAWLEKLGVKFVEKPHQFQLGKSDDYVRRMVHDVAECPQSAAGAAAVVLGQEAPAVDRAIAAVSLPVAQSGGARKWLKSASSMFGTQSKKLDQPMPLSEFARRSRTHSGDGRRDQLSPGERTRVLRMLRDVGGRIADEESQVSMLEDLSAVSYVAALPGGPRGAPMMLDERRESGGVGTQGAMPLGRGRSPRGIDDQNSPPPEPRVERLPGIQPPMTLDDDEVSPKQAVIVGLAKAMSRGPTSTRARRPSGAPPTPPHGTPPGQDRAKRPSELRVKRPSVAPPPVPRPPPVGSWQDEPTRQVEGGAAAELLRAVRTDTAPRSRPVGSPFDDESTRAVDMDAAVLMAASPDDSDVIDLGRGDASTGAIDLGPRAESRRFAKVDPPPEDATAFADVSDLARRSKPATRPPEIAGRTTRKHPAPSRDDKPRAAGDATGPRSLTDVDWDLD